MSESLKTQLNAERAINRLLMTVVKRLTNKKSLFIPITEIEELESSGLILVTELRTGADGKMGFGLRLAKKNESSFLPEEPE